MSQQLKVAVNLEQDFTDTQKAQARANIGAGTSNSSIVHVTSTLPPVSTDVKKMTVFGDGRTRFDNLFSGVIPSEPGQSESGKVLVANYAGSPAKGTSQWKDVHNIGLREVPTGGSDGQVLTSNGSTYSWADLSPLPVVTHYDASWGARWHSMRQLSSAISSSVTLNTITLDHPITLSAGKRYMIIPSGLAGSVEQTKTVSYTVNNSYSLDLWLFDSSKSQFLGKTAVKLAMAEIANHNTSALGEYPPVGGTYRASFNSYPAIIEPEVDVSLDTLSIINNGNISMGFNSANPALLVFDQRIMGIDVMEIQK